MSLRRTLLASALLAAIGVAQGAAPTSADVPTGPLPRNVVPSLVQLELKMDPQQAAFQRHTRIDVAIAEPTDIDLDARPRSQDHQSRTGDRAASASR